VVTVSSLSSQLRKEFSPAQADLMATVFVQAYDDLVTKAELNELTGAVRELATAQRQTDETVKELAQAQRQTDETVKELAQAQRQTDEAVKELAQAQTQTDETVKELAEAQRHTDETVKTLARAQSRTEFALADLAKQVGGLSNALGGSLEDFACDLVPELLEKHWQMAVTSARPEEIRVKQREREFDVVVRGTIDGRPLVVLCEVKATVSLREVSKFLAAVERLRGDRPGEDIRPLFFGYKANRAAREAIVAAGAFMIFTRGVMLGQQAA